MAAMQEPSVAAASLQWLTGQLDREQLAFPTLGVTELEYCCQQRMPS